MVAWIEYLFLHFKFGHNISIRCGLSIISIYFNSISAKTSLKAAFHSLLLICLEVWRSMMTAIEPPFSSCHFKRVKVALQLITFHQHSIPVPTINKDNLGIFELVFRCQIFCCPNLDFLGGHQSQKNTL